jgi:hypothetical protein
MPWAIGADVYSFVTSRTETTGFWLLLAFSLENCIADGWTGRQHFRLAIYRESFVIDLADGLLEEGQEWEIGAS